jgi:hypothetical protein
MKRERAVVDPGQIENSFNDLEIKILEYSNKSS